MKYIIVVCIMLYAFGAHAMNDEKKSRRKSCSPGRIVSRVLKHSRRNSLTDKVLMKLNLKTDEASSSSNTVKALVTERRANESHSAKSDSRNYSARARENNRNNFVKSLLLSYDSIKKIEARDDDHFKKYKSNINLARYYYRAWISAETPGYLPWIEKLADEEIEPAREAFENKMASLKEAQK